MIAVSYRIEYDSTVDKYEVRPVPSRFVPVLLFSAVFILSMLLSGSRGRDLLGSILIPGEDAVTVQAFQSMTNDLRSGASLYDAVYDFCRIVIYEG